MESEMEASHEDLEGRVSILEDSLFQLQDRVRLLETVLRDFTKDPSSGPDLFDKFFRLSGEGDGGGGK